MFQRVGRTLPTECDPDVEPVYVLQNITKYVPKQCNLCPE